MSQNQYEALRNDIVATINELCVKVDKTGQRVQYNWSYQAVCDDIERANGFKSKAMPDDLKTIVRFEFNKLKSKVQSQDGWTDKTTRISPVFQQGAIELRRTNIATFDNLPLVDKEKGCRYLLDVAGKSLAKANTAEKAMNARKRIRSLEKELDFLQKEIAAQDKLKVEIASLNVKPQVEVITPVEVKA